ncbi:MAG: hypothetical protein NZM42_15180, partial [Gemmatales bacterium]|nr:hypothetical protein [Gemmatales bacterium]
INTLSRMTCMGLTKISCQVDSPFGLMCRLRPSHHSSQVLAMCDCHLARLIYRTTLFLNDAMIPELTIGHPPKELLFHQIHIYA